MGMIRIFLFVVATVVLAVVPPEQARAGDAPKFQVEPFWPKPLPKNWILGQVAGIAVDKDDHIWIIHRPLTLVDDEKGAMQDPPTSKCCTPAPAVLEFDTDGNLLRSWVAPAKAMIGRKRNMAFSLTAKATFGSLATMRATTKS